MDIDFRLYLVAKMYYIDDMQQSEIAKALDISAMMVSRMLDRAKKEGIVTFNVKMPDRINWEMGHALKMKYKNLRDAIVVSTEKDEDSRSQVGIVAANYVHELLKEDAVLGISWGKTISCFINALKKTDCPNITVAQMSGGFLCENEYDMMPSNLIKIASEHLGAAPLFLNAPMFAASEQVKESLMKDQLVHYLHSFYSQMRISVFGLSDIHQSTTMKEVHLLTDAEIDELCKAGAIGDVMGYFINQDGNIVNWSKSPCYMGASLATVAGAPYAICLATGASKRNVMDVAIRNHLTNTIIVSNDLAAVLLDEHDIS